MSSSTPPQTYPGQQGQQGPSAPAPSLPPGGTLQQVQQWQQQMSQLEDRYRRITGQSYRYTSPAATARLPGVPPLAQASMQGSSGVQDLANQLAERYGIAGRGPVVDPSGNFTRMPNSADEAAKFQYISQALANFRSEQAQKASISTLQAGIGLLQSRGRGSLATLQSGAYQSLAQAQQADIERINNMQPDFSYFIEKEMQERREKFERETQRFQRKQQRYGLVGSILGAVAGFGIGGLGGAAMGFQIGGTIGQGAGAY